MILVYAVCKIKPGMDEEFKKAVSTMITMTRAEAGNMTYDLGKEEENKYVFVERWLNERALDEHMKAKHFLDAGKKLESILAEPMEIHNVRGV